MTTTDIIISIAIFYFIYRGWTKGLARTLLGPVSLIVGGVVGLTYYHKHHDLFMSILICAVGPFIINILGSILLTLWHTTVNESKSISFSSKMIASGISILWGGSYVLLVVLLIAFAPPLKAQKFQKVQTDVKGSISYAIINKWIVPILPSSTLNLKEATALLSNPSNLEKLKSSSEFKSLLENEQMQSLLNDPETAEQIENKDFSALLSNPKLREALQDPEFLKKMMAFNKEVMKRPNQ